MTLLSILCNMDTSLGTVRNFAQKKGTVRNETWMVWDLIRMFKEYGYLIVFWYKKLLLLQVIPRQLCDNAGFDATDVLNKLRQKHALPSG